MLTTRGVESGSSQCFSMRCFQMGGIKFRRETKRQLHSPILAPCFSVRPQSIAWKLCWGMSATQPLPRPPESVSAFLIRSQASPLHPTVEQAADWAMHLDAPSVGSWHVGFQQAPQRALRSDHPEKAGSPGDLGRGGGLELGLLVGGGWKGRVVGHDQSHWGSTTRAQQGELLSVLPTCPWPCFWFPVSI